MAFNVINIQQPTSSGRVLDALDRLTEPLYRPIRKILPDFGGIDFSPIVLILAIQIVRRCCVDGLALRDLRRPACDRTASSTARRRRRSCAPGVAVEVAKFRAATGRAPGLAVVLVGEDPASAVYVRNKGKATLEAGMAELRA